jgi:hypothetical protein
LSRLQPAFRFRRSPGLQARASEAPGAKLIYYQNNRLRRIAVAGNAVALTLLAMVLANQRVLLGGAYSPANPHLASPGGRGGKMLLVVVDALRNDSSLDPALMPNLTRLGREGRRGTARVESWIPSTVAGIRSIVEGRVPPPASFLQDFGASRSRDGGIFAVLHAAGRRSFAAGPRLWTDLYGPWLAGGAAEPAIGGDDGRLLRSGLDALAGGYDLVVVHLSGPDDAAHLHGGRSREYAAAVHRADAALGRLIARAGPAATILVTSDHGVTAQGGHAGPEPEVVTVPVIVHGPGLQPGNLATIRQRELGSLILPALGLSPLPTPPSRDRPGPWPVVFILLALGFAAVLCHRVAEGAEGRHAATVLNAALWIALALAAAGLPRIALLASLAALAVSPWLVESPVQKRPRWIGLALLAAGALLGILRLLGGTASLSRLDLRLAFRAATGPAGLPGAVAVALLLQALPILLVILLAGPALARTHPHRIGGLAAGLALALLGQGAVAALAIAFSTWGPLAVGLLVRLIGETTFLFLGGALVVFAAKGRIQGSLGG